MKRKILILFILPIFWPLTLPAQEIITLKECYERAMGANALAGEKEAYSKIWRIRDENLEKGWLPTIDANATISYNSDVVDMNGVFSALPIPGLSGAIAPMPKDQYKLTLDINQVIYDGGAIRGTRDFENAELRINEKQNEIDLYKIRSQINACYFGILQIEKQRELLTNYRGIIEKRLRSMESSVSNGVILKSDFDLLLSEKLRIEQQISEAEIRNNSLISLLADITGTEIDSSTKLLLPASSDGTGNEIIRPELQLFDLRKEQLSASMNVIQSKRMPKAFGFASLGYGNPPGMNFFNDNFDTYYIFGGGIKWNVFDWNKAKNEKQLLALQQGIIENRKKDLSDNLQRLLDSKNAEIESLSKMIETDSRLIALRKEITATAESQYDNGSITATDFLNELNSEKQAMINYEIHKINLALAKIEYINISGNEIE